MKSHAPRSLAPASMSGPTADPSSVDEGYGNGFMQAVARGAMEGSSAPTDTPALGAAAAESLDPTGTETGEGFGRAWSDGCSQTHLDQDGAEVQEPAALANPISITVSNHRPAPGGAAFDRTRVGIGEKVNFDAMVDGEMAEGGRWSATGGRGSVSDGFYEWQAPGVAGAFRITYTQDGRSNFVDMTVVAPDAITSTVASTLSPERAGAGMMINVVVGPLDVSFAEAEIYEEPGPGVGTGYFQNRTIDHNAARGAGTWNSLDSANSLEDHAEMAGWPRPWSEGTHTWTIPVHYRAAGGPSTLFHTADQVFTILDTAGNSTISKFGSSV